MPLPSTEDPFDDDLGYGAAIHVVSTNVRHRLTWGILNAVMQGLWDFLIEGRRFLVCEPGGMNSSLESTCFWKQNFAVGFFPRGSW